MLANQFRKYYIDLKGKGLNLSEKAYMTAIYDRLESSKQRKTFYDEEEQDFYVIYTIDEMANELEIGTSTVKRTMKSLINKGWIKTKKVHRNVNCIFVCDQYKVCKSSSSNSKKTVLTQLDGSKWSTNHINKQTKNNLDTCMSQKENFSAQHIAEQSVELNGLEYTLLHKLCLPKAAINALFDVSDQSINNIKNNLSIILKAKRIATKQAKKELYFENSAEIQGTIANRIRYIFMQANTVAKKPKQYILQAFVNYFYEILCPKQIVKARTYIHKSGYQEKLPDWALQTQSSELHKCDNKDNVSKDITILMERINSKTKTTVKNCG